MNFGPNVSRKVSPGVLGPVSSMQKMMSCRSMGLRVEEVPFGAQDEFESEGADPPLAETLFLCRASKVHFATPHRPNGFRKRKALMPCSATASSKASIGPAWPTASRPSFRLKGIL